MKADTTTAMHQLIEEVRNTIPFDIPEEVICSGICHGCSKKLLEFLDTELEDWASRITSGETPNLGDIQKLGKQSQKIYNALKKSGVVEG